MLFWQKKNVHKNEKILYRIGDQYFFVVFFKFGLCTYEKKMGNKFFLRKKSQSFISRIFNVWWKLVEWVLQLFCKHHKSYLDILSKKIGSTKKFVKLLHQNKTAIYVIELYFEPSNIFFILFFFSPKNSNHKSIV